MVNNIGDARRAYARAHGGFTQDDAAARLSVAVSTYRKWEQGCTAVSGEQLGRLADLYGVSVDYLLRRPAAPARPGAPEADGAAAELLRRLSRLNPAGRARLLEAAAILGDCGRYALA